jgi:aryl sulfotransferase
MTAPHRYTSADEDSGRWDDFRFRDGDIVISTRSKSGTTWMQMICALLVFQTPELPAALSSLSPWLDWLVRPHDQVLAELAAQTHRRFVKTHTPLDGVPVDARATYIVVGRHPLDVAVSLYHHGANIDRARWRELTGQPPLPPDAPPRFAAPLRDWVLDWVEREVAPVDGRGRLPGAELDSLPGIMWHTSDAWARRAEPNVLLVHYHDLVTDLEGQMRALAGRLGIEVAEAVWPGLVAAASFSRMRERAEQVAPDAGGVLADRAAFFRRGGSGDGAALLSGQERAGYERRAAALAAPEVLAWLQRP